MTRLLIATRDGIHMLAGSATALRGSRIDHVASLDRVVGAVESGGVTLLRPDGVSTARVDLPDVEARCLARHDGTLLVGTSEARLFAVEVSEDGRVGDPSENVAFERHPARNRWHTPWGGPPDTRWIAAAVDGTVYVNVHVGGILRLRPGEAEWTTVLPIEHDTHQVVAHPDRSTVVVAATALGLAVSRDGGDSWDMRTAGLDGVYCRAVAIRGDDIFVSASRGSRGARAGVYRGGLDSPGLTRCTAGLPEWFSTNVNSGCLAIDGRAAYIGDERGTVYRSPDGTTWEVAADRLPGVLGMAVDPPG